jgi:uncharacterized protein YecE (DUF72 family)
VGDATLLVGTSGYSYADWKGPFYPASCRQEEMLGLYAARFDTVELNFSYYRQPTAKQLSGISDAAAAVNPAFTFSVKAYKGITHEVAAGWEEEAAIFREAAEALRERGRLAAVLLQFPFSFHYTADNRRHLDRALRLLAPLPCACEFRSREWFIERVYDGLRARGAALAAVDEPQLDGLPPPLAIPTGPLGYIRFHGRNAANWWRGDNASRYDYLYSDEELRGWLPKAAELARAATTVVAYFNNHWNGQAAANAARFRELLATEPG